MEMKMHDTLAILHVWFLTGITREALPELKILLLGSV